MIKRVFAGSLFLVLLGTVAAVAAERHGFGAPPRARSTQPVQPVSFLDSSLSCTSGTCGGESCGTCGMVEEPVWVGDACGPTCSLWSSGVEFTIVKPHFEGNTAFTLMDGDGVSFETFTESQFNFDTELAPRVWIERRGNEELGFRVVYWQFDHESATATGSPPDSGFGRIEHPAFGDVDLSTTVPGSVYAADSQLNAYSIDVEGTRRYQQGIWGFTTSAGLRFAEVEQAYRSSLTNAQGQTQGTINFAHRVQGVGPTLGVRVERPFSPRLSLFATGRGSLLFGDGESRLNAVEDQDLNNPFTTTRLANRNDVLPVGELQVGFQVLPVAYGMWQPYVHVAMEGQLWSGAGNASSETGDLGFYGLNVAVGFDW